MESSKHKREERKKAAEEYSRRIASREYKVPEELKNKSVLDILDMPEFRVNIGAFMNEQIMLREMVLRKRDEIIKAGKFPAPEKRPCIDEVMRLGLLKNVDDFILEFAKVIEATSKYSLEVRKYIRELGLKAYNLTMEQKICEANPDLAELAKVANKKI